MPPVLKPCALALCLAPLPAPATTLDLLVYHSPGLAAQYGGDATTRINHLISVANQIYADSGLDLQLRLVAHRQVDYPDTGDAYTALLAVTNSSGPFADRESLREQYGADLVALMRPYDASHNGCGIAWIGAEGSDGLFSSGWRNYMIAHVSATTCGDYVTAHELGHNMGLKHSRRQDGSGGTFPYALGYGVDGQFVTIMAYPASFGVDYWAGKVYKFSSPVLSCRGLPCGVNRDDYNEGADAVFTLTFTTPQIAEFYPTRVPDTPNSDTLAQLLQALEDARAALDSANAAQDAARLAVETARADADAAATAYDEAALYVERWITLEERYRNLTAYYAGLADSYATQAANYSGSLRQQLLYYADQFRTLSNQLQAIAELAADGVATYSAQLPPLLAAKEAKAAALRDAEAMLAEATQAQEAAQLAYDQAEAAYRLALNEQQGGTG